MIDDSNVFTATDARRAVALFTHYGSGDLPGVRAILAEAHEADAAIDLAAAAVALAFKLNPELMSGEGKAALQAMMRLAVADEAHMGNGDG